MEINLIEEESKIEEINGYKALQYKVKNNGKNINQVPIYIHWLKLMKAEKGENGLVTYCTKCHLFFYFANLQEKHTHFHHKNCYYEDSSDFCEYCGELYNNDSICCFKKLLELLKIITTEMHADFELWIIIIPFISLWITIICIFKIILSKRINKQDDINYYNHIFDLEYETTIVILLTSMSFINTLSFFIPYHIIYFFHLYFILKLRNQFLKDKENNIIRY